jgi:hypothetical protein
MAAEGLEKITEVPLEFFKDGSAFIKKCQKPDQKGTYVWVFVGCGDATAALARWPLWDTGVALRAVFAWRGELYCVRAVRCLLATVLWLALGVSVLSYCALGVPFSVVFLL